MDAFWMDDYWSAYLLGLNDRPEAQRRLNQGSVWTEYFRKGLRDALTGAVPQDPVGLVPPPGAIPARTRPAPVYQPPVGQPVPAAYVPPPGSPVPVLPGSLVPGGFQVFEVYAHVPLKGGVPLDVAEQLRRQSGATWIGLLASSLVGITLLGADPRDYSAGFRLSGPQGRLARQIAAAIRAGRLYAYPTAYGLDAWYGAQTTRGIRVISLQELQALGLQ